MPHLIVARPLWLAALLLVVLLPAPGLADKKGVRIDGKAPAEYVAAQAGKSWAVVIGINEYEHVRPLQYAVADAQAVAQALRQRGFQVAELYDRDATRGRILGELGDKLVDRVGENDRVLIFYSGHGETKQPKGGKEMGFLLPVGAKADALAETAIPMSVIRDLADELPSKQVLFLVDVCYGGIAGTQFKSVLKYDEAYLREITRERGRQLITAGGPKQEALEGPEWGHSVFTYYLLEGLTKGLADLDEDGIIPASELHTYLTRRVFDAAQSKGHRQRPEMWKLANEPGEFVFFTSARPLPNPLPRAGEGRVEEPGAAPSPNPARVEQPSRQQPLISPEDMSESDRLALMKRQVAEERRRLREARLHAHEEAGQTGQSAKRIDTASPREVLVVSNEKPVRVKSATLLEKGRWYLIEASGVVSNWDGGTDGMDAIWCYAESRCGKQGEVRNQLKINGKGLSEIAGRFLPYDPGHVYRVLVLGEGQKLEFYSENASEDGMYNSGAYTVRIYSEP